MLQHKKSINLKKLITILMIVLGMILIFNIYSISKLSKIVDKKIDIAKEAARPANLQLVIIKDSRCKDCFDIDSIVANIKKANVEIKKEDTIDLSSNATQELIKKYNIEKVPTVLIVGEINKTPLTDLEDKGDYLLFTKLTPPYTDVATNEIKGHVSLTLLKEPSCADCFDLTSFIAQLKQIIMIVKEEEVEVSSEKGEQLINRYNIQKAPALIISKDASEYENFDTTWKQLGTIDLDGNHIMEAISAPYYNITEKRVVGLVELTMLTDNSCSECYDVALHKSILQRYGVKLSSEKTFDVSDNEGKALIGKYDIKLVPTIILSKDADFYPALKQVWQQVGSTENDGTYVFRTVGQMGSYKDLTTNKFIEVSTTST